MLQALLPLHTFGFRVTCFDAIIGAGSCVGRALCSCLICTVTAKMSNTLRILSDKANLSPRCHRSLDTRREEMQRHAWL